MGQSVIGIDPGKRTGWAIFREGALRLAGVLPGRLFLSRLIPVPPDGLVVIEKPVIYPHYGGKGDPNQLVDLAILVGEIVQAYRSMGCEVVLVTPRTWKGSVPKDIHNERVLAKLSEEERVLLPRRPRVEGFDHNMLDAVGLGLWKLRR